MISRLHNESMFLEMYSNIAPTDHYGIIAFFQAHSDIISLLSSEIYLKIFNTYLNSLYELGQYRQYYARVDEMIEFLIMYADDFNREEYAELVFRKSVAAYEIGDCMKSKEFLENYIRISPSSSKARFQFYQTVRQGIKKSARSLYGICIGLLFILASILLAEILALTDSIEESNVFFKYLKLALIIIVLSTLAGIEYYAFWKSKSTYLKILKSSTSL